jgi:Family of unknown function (DUF6232)/Putative peptidoglycan binding domain
MPGPRERSDPDAVVFFNRHGMRITGSWVQVPGRRYAVRDLGEISAVRCPRSRLVVRVVAAVWVALIVGGLVIVWVSAWVRRLGLLALLVMLLGVALGVLRANPARVVLCTRASTGVRSLLVSNDLQLVNQVYRALCRAREYDIARRRLAGEQVPADPTSCGGFRSIMDGPAYSVLAGFGALLLMTVVLMVAGGRGPSRPSAEPLSDGAVPATLAGCGYVAASYRPRLETGAGSGGSDEVSHAVEQVQCLIDYNSGYPVELEIDLPLGIDGLFGLQTQHGVLWVQQCNGIDQDGIVNQDTWDKLYAPSPDCGP